MKNYSVAIFGSSLRADFDKYSDRDLLVVAKDFKTLEKIKSKYINSDWSISYYTYSKLEYLSKNGSLFIKHLQDESEVLFDGNNKLSKVLAEFVEKDNYEKDIEDSIRYFEVLKIIPKTNLGFAWFCDCFYVGLRNYLVFKNAENGIFEFSFIKLLNLLKAQGIINESDIEILRELRVVKRNYREDILDELPSFEYIKKVIPIIIKIGVMESMRIIESQKFQDIVEENITKLDYNPYQRLRLVEGYYTSQELKIPELKKIISNPQFYSLKMKSNDFTMSLISKIKKHHKKLYSENGNMFLKSINLQSK